MSPENRLAAKGRVEARHPKQKMQEEPGNTGSAAVVNEGSKMKRGAPKVIQKTGPDNGTAIEGRHHTPLIVESNTDNRKIPKHERQADHNIEEQKPMRCRRYAPELQHGS